MFSVFISLGYFCGVASSMGKMGIRDGSYPFDWVLSQLKGVLHFVDNDFEDFLCRDHLIEEGSRFYDKWQNMDFIHDGSISKVEEYKNICEKYKHRIERFRKATQNGNVCFIRAIRDWMEVRWIVENAEYITKVISKFPDSKIIFLFYQGMGKVADFPFPFYMMNLYGWMGDTRYQLRSSFDTNKEFLSYCQSNYPKQKLEDNKEFDAKQERERVAKEAQISRKDLEQKFLQIIDRKNRQIVIERSRVNRIMMLAGIDFEICIREKIIIYGAGDIGKLLADKLNGKREIICFLDQKPKENEYRKIPIYRPWEYKYDGESLIVVVPSYDYDKIVTNLENTYGKNTRRISLEDFVQKNLRPK